MSKVSWTALALAIGFWIGASVPANAGVVNLGAAAKFALIANGGDLFLGDGCDVGRTSVSPPVLGDVGVWNGDSELGYKCKLAQNLADINNSSTPTITLDGDPALVSTTVPVAGECSTNAGGVINFGFGTSCGATNTGGGSSHITDLNSAHSDLANFEAEVVSLSATQTIPSIILDRSKTKKVFDTVHGGLNVIDIGTVTLDDYATLYFSGRATDKLVIRITGTLTMGSQAKIVLIGGVNNKKTYIDATALGAIDNGASVDGTLHVQSDCLLSRKFKVKGGSLYCEGGVGADNFLEITFVPNQLVL